MSRLTHKLENSNLYVVDEINIKCETNGYSGEVIEKLAKFENLYDSLVTAQIDISKELEKLRIEGKTKTVKFNQLLATKLTNSNILSVFKTYGLE